MSQPIIQQALEVTRDNIRSLGPAGALAHIHAPYVEWLALVEGALADTGECICPKCGIRHGLSNTDGGF